MDYLAKQTNKLNVITNSALISLVIDKLHKNVVFSFNFQNLTTCDFLSEIWKKLTGRSTIIAQYGIGNRSI